MRPYDNELKSVTIAALKQEWLAMHHLQKHLPFLNIMICLICCWQDVHVKTENTIAGHRGTNALPMAIKAKHLIQITQLVQTPLQSLLNTCCSLRLLRYTQHGPKLDSITPPKIIKNYYQKGYFPAEQTSITMLENVRPKKKGRVLLLLKQTSFLVIEKV